MMTNPCGDIREWDIAPWSRVVFSACFVLVLLTVVASAQPVSSFSRYEIRGGVLAHDPASPEAGSADLNGEVLAPRLPLPVDAQWSFLLPRPHLGGTLSLAGRTSHLYAGLTWGIDLSTKFFVEASWGGALNNGDTHVPARVNRNAMGCRAGFRESASLGYRLTPDLSVMTMVEHVSNGGFCEQNRGLTNVGLRLGYAF